MGSSKTFKGPAAGSGEQNNAGAWGTPGSTAKRMGRVAAETDNSPNGSSSAKGMKVEKEGE